MMEVNQLNQPSTVNLMILYFQNVQKKIRALSSQLGPLLRVNTPEGFVQAGRKACHLVLPNDQPKEWKNADNASICQALPSDEILERVTKGLEIKWVPWIVDCDGGNIVEVDDGPRIILSLSKRFTRKRKKEEFKKEAFKKGA
ncbi:hypothetical protein GLOIN_2v1470429 [Rhizophagus clarus]|uniref:Uncharacterized protein n=1 Tax=Rhizophagus clarus TaxID=94130 RepID=A0A8H3R1J0_9GLOM|nr:hypothetical protein GLOIN_2v1470429 [Rhizophagus clarus]